MVDLMKMNFMEKEYIILTMVIYIKVILNLELKKVMEYIVEIMKIFNSKENGMMIYRMVMEC